MAAENAGNCRARAALPSTVAREWAKVPPRRESATSRISELGSARAACEHRSRATAPTSKNALKG